MPWASRSDSPESLFLGALESCWKVLRCTSCLVPGPWSDKQPELFLVLGPRCSCDLGLQLETTSPQHLRRFPVDPCVGLRFPVDP